MGPFEPKKRSFLKKLQDLEAREYVWEVGFGAVWSQELEDEDW